MLRRRCCALMGGAIRSTAPVLCTATAPTASTAKPRQQRRNLPRGGGLFGAMRDLGDVSNIDQYRHERPRHQGGTLNPIDSLNYFKTELQSTWRDNRALKDFLSKDELARFMTVADAAKRLGIEESQLAKLTGAELETHWAKAYASAKNQTEQLELSAAAEALLQYLQTDTQREVLAAHNRKVMNDFKASMAQRKQKESDEMVSMITIAFGAGMVGVGLFLISLSYYFAFTRDMEVFDNIWNNLSNHLSKVLLNPPDNTTAGAPPDYTTRYRDTKSALDEHLESQEATSGALDPLHHEILQEKVHREKEEERFVIQIFNEVNAELQTKAKEERLAESRIRVIRKEDLGNFSNEKQDIVLKNGLVITPLRELTLTGFRDFLWGIYVMSLRIKNNANTGGAA